MTELLYLTDAYTQQFEAIVTAHHIDEERGFHGVVLDRTAFYPGGGGQPCDFGTLSAGDEQWAVRHVRKVNGKPVHFIETALPAVGTTVIGQIDWDRRYKLMRTHTAMHILCGVIWRDYGAPVTGGNMEPMAARMDFEFETIRKEFVAVIEEAINVEVAAERPVQVHFLTPDEAAAVPDLVRTKTNLVPDGLEKIRTIELEGLDYQADGGTHVRNTSEIGRIKIPKYKSKGKINKRIYVEIE